MGVSLHRLAGAVAREGGVGIISTAQIGFQEPDFTTNFVEANSAGDPPGDEACQGDRSQGSHWIQHHGSYQAL